MTAEEIAAGIAKMIKDREGWLKSCERMIELLQPEWDKFEARDGHDLYVSRDYADHTSQARTHRKDLELLYAVRSILEGTSHADQ